MAKKDNSNRAQKNGVRYALATAATIMTLFGAQSLALRSTTAAQATQITVVIKPTTDSQTKQIAASATTVPTQVISTANATSPTAVVTATPTTVVTARPTTVQPTQITVAAAQPAPRSQSSR